MPTTADYLNDLVEQKRILANNISAHGVEVSEGETFNTLVDKILLVFYRGKDYGLLEGESEGRNKERLAFWEDYQQNGKRTNYNHAFAGAGWTYSNFNPQYPIAPTSAYMMFRESEIEFDYVVHTATFDFSKCKDMAYTFSLSKVKTLDTISFESCTALNNTFRSATQLTSINYIVLKEDGSNTFSNAFYGCSNLVFFDIKGTISNNGFNVSDSPLLSVMCLENIINALADKSGDAKDPTTNNFKWTCTLGATNLAKLSDDLKATAIAKGWNLA